MVMLEITFATSLGVGHANPYYMKQRQGNSLNVILQKEKKNYLIKKKYLTSSF